MKQMHKKGMGIADVPQFVIILVVSVIILGAGLLALDGFNDSLTAGSYANNATLSGLEGLDNVSDQLPVIGTIAGVAVLITIVVGAFFALRGRV